MKNKWFAILLSFFLFSICFYRGILLAKNRPIWNDEFYTQVASIKLSYAQIISFHLFEGNNNPLFYLVQKAICDLTGYVTPARWFQGDWYSDPKSQIVLRLNSIIFMSLSALIISYFFAREYSLGLGCYSFILAVSSYVLIAYAVEARPYALWFFLSTWQFLLFVKIIKTLPLSNDLIPQNRRLWITLTIVHLLLSLTVVMSLVQIAVVAFLLWLFVDKKIKNFIFLFFIPAAICIFYYSRSIHLTFWFRFGPLALLNSSFPKERMVIFLIFGLYLLWLYWKSKGSSLLPPKDKEFGIYFLLTSLMLLGYCLILLKFKLAAMKAPGTFEVPNRYFIALSPLSIIVTTLFSYYLLKISENKVVKTAIFSLLGIFLLFRLYMAGYIQEVLLLFQG